MIQNRHETNISCTTCPVAKLCLCDDLSKDELQCLDNSIHHNFTFDKGEHLFYLNDKLESVFAVYSGSCKEYVTDADGKEYIHNFYFPGDLIGLECFNFKSYPYSAISLEQTHLCVIPIKQLISVIKNTEHLPFRLLTIFSKKIRNDTSIRLTTNAKQRVADFILHMHMRFSERGCSEEIPLTMPQLDMSNRIGVAFETVSRILHAFQRDNIISMEGKNIQIRDLARLRDISGIE